MDLDVPDMTDSLCGTLSSKYPRIGVFKHQWVGQMDLDVPDMTDSLCGTLSSKYPRIGVFKHQWVGQMDLDVPDTVQQISMHWIASSKVDNPNGYCPAKKAIHVIDGVSHI